MSTFFALYHNKRLLLADPCCRFVIKEFAHAFSCAYIELWMHLGVWRALKKLELLSAAPRATLTHFPCSPNFPRASITRYTHAKHEKILKYPNNCVYVALRCAFMETWSAWKVLRSLKKLHLPSASPRATSLSLSKLPVCRP